MGRRHAGRKRSVPQSPPPQQPQKTQPSQQLAAVQLNTFSGPLPPPEALARYNDIEPGMADRIVRMAEHQAEHRQRMESAVITGNIRAEARGQHYGLAISLIVVLGSLWLISTGHGVLGLAGIVATLASLAAVFVWGRLRKEKDLARSRRGLTVPPEQE